MAVLTLPSDVISPAKEEKKASLSVVYLLFQLDHQHLTDSYSFETINPVSLTVEKGATFLCLTMWACNIRSAWYACISHLDKLL